ncbi:MAG: BsaA family SipW-dependent biofilm matrix protein [Clostridiaceae bacterium]|nr:BsaA family SipW-dependent biofilm matrix protein [Clostridiaceae bacterium]
MKKKKLLIVMALVAVIFCFSVGITYASFSSKDSVDNLFMTGKVAHVIEEEFDPGGYKKEEDIPKIVKLRNDSNVATFMRISIVPMWVTVDDSGKEIPWAGDTSNVIINYNTDFIGEMNSYSKDNYSEWYNHNAHKWVEDKTLNGNIHYFYYTKILMNESSTSQIIDSVNYKIPESQEDRYEGKKLKIKVKSEIVLANKDAIDCAWSDLKDEKIKEMLLNLPKGE